MNWRLAYGLFVGNGLSMIGIAWFLQQSNNILHFQDELSKYRDNDPAAFEAMS